MRDGRIYTKKNKQKKKNIYLTTNWYLFITPFLSKINRRLMKSLYKIILRFSDPKLLIFGIVMRYILIHLIFSNIYY